MGCLHLYKPKWSSIKRDRFCVKTTLFAGQDAKTRHKNTHGMADKHPRIHGKALHRPGSAPLPHPGLRGSYTRVSVALTPGSQAALQAVFDKRKAGLDEK